MTSRSPLTRKEWYVVLALLAGAGLWQLMPVVPQPASYHGFADDRSFLGIPNAADVLSNLHFVVVGALGRFRVQQGHRPLAPVVRFSLNVFFLGLFLTGFGSAY